MVPKDALSDLFDDKVKVVLSDVKENTLNIKDYCRSVSLWFAEYKRDEIDRSGFDRFLKHLEVETGKLLDEVQASVKPSVIDALNTFLEEVEEHSSDEVSEKIEDLIRRVGGDVESIQNRKKLMKFSSGWKTPVIVLFVLVLAVIGVFYLMGESSGSELLVDDELFDDNLSLDEDDLMNESSDVDGGVVGSADKKSSLSSGAILTPLEREVFNLVNEKRRSYYINELDLDVNYNRMLKNGTSDVVSELELLAFVYEVDEEVSLKGEDSAQTLFDQMTQRNLFDEELTHFAIKIDEVAYKIYRVRMAYYEMPEEEN